jgi:hypothetical protein
VVGSGLIFGQAPAAINFVINSAIMPCKLNPFRYNIKNCSLDAHMFILKNVLSHTKKFSIKTSTDSTVVKDKKNLKFFFKNDRMAKVISALKGINK